MEALEITGNKVFRVTYAGVGCSSLCKPTLQESSPGSADWKTLLAGLSHPSQSSSAQFANSGSALLLALYGNEAAGVSAQAQLYRSTDNGSNWTLMSETCSGKLPSASTREANLISLAATGGIFHRPLQSPQWLHYFHGSLDRCWQAMVICWSIAQPDQLRLIAAASSTTLAAATGVVSGAGRYTAKLLASFDGAKTWRIAGTDTQQLAQMTVPAWLGFETSRSGKWLSGPDSLWTTNDGALDWSKAQIGVS